MIGGGSTIFSVYIYFINQIHSIPIYHGLQTENLVANGGLFFLLKKYGMNKNLSDLDDFLDYKVFATFSRHPNPSSSYFSSSDGWLFSLHSKQISSLKRTVCSAWSRCVLTPKLASRPERSCIPLTPISPSL